MLSESDLICTVAVTRCDALRRAMSLYWLIAPCRVNKAPSSLSCVSHSYWEKYNNVQTQQQHL